MEDGATLQMGIGGIPNAVLSALGNHKVRSRSRFIVKGGGTCVLGDKRLFLNGAFSSTLEFIS